MGDHPALRLRSGGFLSPEPINRNRLRLGELPPPPNISECLRLRLQRRSSSICSSDILDVDSVFWDAYDRMAPVENRPAYTSRTRWPPATGTLHTSRAANLLPQTMEETLHNLNWLHINGARDAERCAHSFDQTSALLPKEVLPSLSSVDNMSIYNMVHVSSDLGMELFEDASSSPNACASGYQPTIHPDKAPEMFLQPATRPIPHEQLVVEMSGIYASLDMAKAKGVEIENTRPARTQDFESLYNFTRQIGGPQPSKQEFQHKHADLLLALKHPDSPSISELLNDAVSKPVLLPNKDFMTCERKPSILYNFGNLGVIVAFSIVQWFENMVLSSSIECLEGVMRASGGHLAICKMLEHNGGAWESTLKSIKHGEVIVEEKKVHKREVSEKVPHHRTQKNEMAEPSAVHQVNENLHDLPNGHKTKSALDEQSKASTSEAEIPVDAFLPEEMATLDICKVLPGPMDRGRFISFNHLILHADCLALMLNSSRSRRRALLSHLPAPVPSVRTKNKSVAVLLRRARSHVKTCHLLVSLGILTIGGSLVPALWRSAYHDDIQGGFSVAQYILGVGVFIIGSMIVIHSRTCTCWQS